MSESDYERELLEAAPEDPELDVQAAEAVPADDPGEPDDGDITIDTDTDTDTEEA